MTIVIINEQHSLLPQQRELLEADGGFSELKIPASGLNLAELKELAGKLRKSRDRIVFLSPIPALMSLLAGKKRFSVFHNDKRDKRELPNGKIIMTPAKKGWVIV